MQPSHLLKIDSLGSGWCDKDFIILHACFQLLADFAEKEMLVQDYPDWDATEETKNAKKEIEELYAWWQERKKLDSTREMDAGVYLKDNEMLKRLVDVRMYLWT